MQPSSAADLMPFASLIYERLSRTRMGVVLAVWPNVVITEQELGFRGRRTAAGSLIEPLVTFIAGGGLSRDAIRERLQQKLARRQRPT